MRGIIATAFSISIMLATALSAEEWPRWRGPHGDGISRETGLAESWPAEGPRKLWTQRVGIGYSSPVAVDGRVYLMTLVDGKDTLTAFDAESGKIIWSNSYDGGWGRAYPGSRATPTIEGNVIYTYGGGGDVVAWDRASGAIIWRRNVLEETGADNLNWGSASSPLIFGNLIYVQGGRGSGVPVALALDKSDGRIVWRSEARGKAAAGGEMAQGGGYAHPIIAHVEGQPQLIIFASDAVIGMNPQTGATLWSQPWKTDWDVNASTPVYRDGLLFVTSGYRSGSMMLRLTAQGATRQWASRDLRARFQGVILDGDFIYGHDEGTIKCLAWPSGEVKWVARDPELRMGNGGSMVRFGGDKMILLSERGKLSLAKVTPEGIEVISRVNDFVDGREVWSTPLIYRGKLYVKGATELVCADISAK